MLFSDFIILLIIIAVAVLFFLYKYKNKINRRRLKNKIKSSNIKYLDYLEENGYKIVNGNRSITLVTETGSSLYEDKYNTPLIVKKQGIKYLVHIKRSDAAFRINKKIRQYFFTLCVIFRACGILIIDSKNFNIKKLTFKNLIDRKKKTVMLILFIIIVAAVFLVLNFY